MGSILTLTGVGAGGSVQPNQIANLVLWVKADTGTYQDSGGTTPASADGDPVRLWKDQSGGGNDLSCDIDAKRPNLKLNVLNGRPTVRSPVPGANGVNLSNGIAASGAWSFFLATRALSNAGNNGAILALLNSSFRILFVHDTNGDFSYYQNGAAGITDFGVSSLSWAVVSLLLIDNTHGDFRVDGGASTLFTPAAFNAQAGISLFGDSVNGGNMSNSDVAELIVYNRAVTSVERGQVEAYLDGRYAIY